MRTLTIPTKTKKISYTCNGVNQLCLSQLYQKNFLRVKDQAKQILNDESLANDLAQEVFFKLLRNPEMLNRVDNMKYWITRVTRNLCIDFIRKQKRRKKAEESSIDYFYAYTPRDDWDEEELKYDKLFAQIEKLKEADKDIINRKYFLNEKINTISKDLNISSSAVKMRLTRARKQIRQAC